MNQNLGEQSQRLLKTAKPYPDESFSGYILRLATLNFYSNSKWICDRANIPTYYLSKIDFIPVKGEALVQLSEITGIEQNILNALTYNLPDELPAKRFKNHLRIFNQIIHKYFLHGERLKICPECLVKKPYHRKIWDLLIVTACPIHRSLLVDLCSKCQARIAWEKPPLLYCQCGQDRRKIKTKNELDKADVYLSWYVYKLCNLPVAGKLRSSLFKGLSRSIIDWRELIDIPVNHLKSFCLKSPLGSELFHLSQAFKSLLDCDWQKDDLPSYTKSVIIDDLSERIRCQSNKLSNYEIHQRITGYLRAIGQDIKHLKIVRNKIYDEPDGDEQDDNQLEEKQFITLDGPIVTDEALRPFICQYSFQDDVELDDLYLSD